MRKVSRYWSLRTTILLLLLIVVGWWGYSFPDLVAANNWSWEKQLQMEETMVKAAQLSPGQVPELDRSIPQTETALFALG